MRRHPAAVVSLVALLATAVACAGDDSLETARDPRTGEAVTTTTGGGASPPVLPTTTGVTAPGAPPTSAAPGAPAPTTAPPAPRETGGGDPAYDASGPPGSYADTLLRPQPAARLVVEVLSQGGAAPRQATVDHLIAVLRDVSGKPVALRTAGVGGERRSWTAADVVAAADAAGMTAQGDGTAVIRLLYLRGHFSEHERALGVAVRGSVAAVFHDKVHSASSPVVPAAAIEDAVTVHELGHLLGLVDLFLDTGRDDPEHPHHSRNRESVMYYAVEVDLVGQILSGPPPNEFDDDDRADLRRIRQG